MTAETKIEYVPSLYQLGLYLQEQFDAGYRIVEGWPLQTGWQYEVKMTKTSKKKNPDKGGA